MARAIDAESGFLIAFDESANYQGANFTWFKQRYARFVYVDRIVIAEAARGRGLAKAFYAALIEEARVARQSRVVCEVNIAPPNPESNAFHDRLGFQEVGQATLDNGKVVRYLELAL
jgi:predicted GNAT superfamily acetyltransferase